MVAALSANRARLPARALAGLRQGFATSGGSTAVVGSGGASTTVVGSGGVAAAGSNSVTPGPSFKRDIWPILASECAMTCHVGGVYGDFRTPETAYAALSDTTRRVGRFCNEGETPLLPVLSPGDPDGSGLWRLIGIGYRGCADVVYGMPKDGRGLLRDFNPSAAELIRSWIERGAAND